MRDCLDKVPYIHRNPVKAGWVKTPEDWKWSILADYAEVSGEEQEHRCGLTVCPAYRL
jgi:hypothetical protein